jgi:molybdenum cofactor synthesis domain-containing protein
VIPIEDVVILDDKSEIKITKFLKKGSFVYLAGSDIKKDKKVMNKGQVIRAQHIGLLATLQMSTVSVYQKPIISIIPTGSELTDDIEEANNNNNNNQQTKVVNTNSHILSYLIRELGGSPVDMGITPDSVDILREKIIKGLRISDMVLTIGGTSAGEHDIVKSTINQIGSPGMIANKVKLDRGRVAGIAAIGQKPIIVLPGPVQGALNAFIVFARPLMSLLSGRNNVNNFTLSARLDQDWVARKKFHTFRKILYVKLSKIKPENNFIAKPIIGETQSISLLSEANAFVVIPEEVSELYEGDIVEVNLLPGFSYMHDFQVIG